MNMLRTSTLPAVGKVQNIVLWVLQIGVAVMFLMAGEMKLAGAPMMVAMFAKIGLGQWFRVLTGTLEVLGGIGLLTPRLSGVAATMLAGVMAGAVATHLFILGGSFVVPLVLLAVSAVIAWGRSQQVLALLAGVRSARPAVDALPQEPGL